MDLVEINQKLDKILEYQEEQKNRAKIRFWVNLVLLFIFVILPLILLPMVVSQVFNIYSDLGAGNLEEATQQAEGIMKLFGQ